MKRIVPIYPWPMHPKVAEQLAAMPEVKPVEALPGGPDPVLAIMKLPTFVCDAILVKSPQKLAQGVEIVIGDDIEMVSMRETISRTFYPNGVPITEYIDEGQVSKVKFV
jgi:hypothetical protein